MVEDRTHSDLELRKSPEIRETLIDTSSDRSGRYLFKGMKNYLLLDFL